MEIQLRNPLNGDYDLVSVDVLFKRILDNQGEDATRAMLAKLIEVLAHNGVLDIDDLGDIAGAAGAWPLIRRA